MSSLLQDIGSESRLNHVARRRSSAQREFEAIPLDEFQQFPENGAGTGAVTPSKLVFPEPALSEITEGIIALPNQKAIIGIDCIDMQGSLSFRFSRSQWMTIVMWFFCLQFLMLVAIMFTFLVVGQPFLVFPDHIRPAFLLKNSVFSVFVVQPLNSFVAVALGLYIGDGQASKLQLILLCILILFLLAWSVLSVFPFFTDLFSWYYALGPLVGTVIQFLYLSFR